MADMQQNDFMRDSREAVERMREMNARSKFQDSGSHRMPPVPPFVKIPNNRQAEQRPSAEDRAQKPRQNTVPPKNSAPKTSAPQSNGNSLLGIPFLNSLGKDSDTTLILGLLLILFSEKADKLLLFALVYILL